MAIRARHSIPALALVLLLFQVILPWTAEPFVTQDGPSHLYTARVVRELLLHHQPYTSVYRFQHKLVTNWTVAILLNVLAPITGWSHAEQALYALCVLAAFFSVSHLLGSIHPLTNFLINTWFLWIGFYNFYLGMAICLFLIGYYARRGAAMSWRAIALFALALVVLFFTHVLALALALVCIVLLSRTRAVLAVVPAALLLIVFVASGVHTAPYRPEIAKAWSDFPMHVFAAGTGRTGGQELLRWPILFYILAAAFLMRRSDRVVLMMTAALSFVAYLLVPNECFGGDEIKIRFAWAIFLFGAMAAFPIRRLRVLQLPLAIYSTAIVGANLIQAGQQNVWNVSDAVAVYHAALGRIPEGATFVRIRHPLPEFRKRYGIDAIALEPLLHADAAFAARKRCLDLSDYQALSGLFPIAFQNHITQPYRMLLWDMETGGGAAAVDSSPVPIDFVVTLQDQDPFVIVRDARVAPAILK